MHSMYTSMPAATARSWSVRIISRPVRSPTWASRGCEWPPNGRWRIRPSSVRSKTAPHTSSSRTRSGASMAWSWAIRGLLRQLAADHRVAEVDLPRVVRGDVGERRRDAALGHDRVGLAEQRLADEPDVRAGGPRLDRRPQPGAAGADDEDVVGRVCGSVGSIIAGRVDASEVDRRVGDDAEGEQADVDVGEGDRDEARSRPTPCGAGSAT